MRISIEPMKFLVTVPIQKAVHCCFWLHREKFLARAYPLGSRGPACDCTVHQLAEGQVTEEIFRSNQMLPQEKPLGKWEHHIGKPWAYGGLPVYPLGISQKAMENNQFS